MRTATARRTSDSTDARLRAVVGRFLHMDERALDGRTALTAYGLDSLSALELVATLEDEFSCELPEWLLTDCPDLASLAEAIDGDTASVAPNAQFVRDAVLPEDVRPTRAYHARRADARPADWRNGLSRGVPDSHAARRDRRRGGLSHAALGANRGAADSTQPRGLWIVVA